MDVSTMNLRARREALRLALIDDCGLAVLSNNALAGRYGVLDETVARVRRSLECGRLIAPAGVRVGVDGVRRNVAAIGSQRSRM